MLLFDKKNDFLSLEVLKGCLQGNNLELCRQHLPEFKESLIFMDYKRRKYNE